MTWISIKEKFPPEKIVVLGLYMSGVDQPQFISVEWSWKVGWINRDFPINWGITHWMHLPELPK